MTLRGIVRRIVATLRPRRREKVAIIVRGNVLDSEEAVQRLTHSLCSEIERMTANWKRP